MPPATISNGTIRRLLLSLNGHAPAMVEDPLPVPGASSEPLWALGMVRRLGFVQVDPISAVERAHHHILFSRNPRYRQSDLERLLEQDRALFENWTHDAAILPVEHFPYWRHYMERFRRYEIHAGYRRYFAPVTPGDETRVRKRIEKEGPLRPRDLGGERVPAADAVFSGPSLARLTLERLWRIGELAITRRDSRQKVYDLTDRVIPEEPFRRRVDRRAYVSWACRESLLRLGAATAGQIARFFDAVSTEDAARWCRGRLGRDVVEVRVTASDGSVGSAVYALREILDLAGEMPAPTRRLRLLNPFDPLIRDRARTRRLFGFDYTIEIWVPAAKRKYGYYVLPILESQRFTGRVDVKADRKRGVLRVLGLWWEPGVRQSKKRHESLERELGRLGRFCGAPEVQFTSPSGSTRRR